MPPINVEVTAQVDDAVRGLTGINSQFDLMKQANRDAAGALGVFGVSLTALNSPLTAVASGIKDSIDTTLAWGETIQKLAAASGQTAEKASTMATVFGDFGINVDSLDKTVKQFTKNGLTFNLDTIKQLAEQYQSITDPVQRDKFAFDNFGRSALDMNEILSASPAKLQAMADAAQTSGKVIDDVTVKSMEDFRLKAAELNDKVDGIKIALGDVLVPVLSRAADGFTGLVMASNDLGIALQLKAGIITHDEAVARLDAAAHGDLFAEFKNVTKAAVEYGPPLDKMVSSTQQLADNTNASAVAYESAASGVVALTDGQIKAKDATDKLAAAAAEASAKFAVQAGMQGTVTQGALAYEKTVDGNKDKITALTAELAKYTAEQGQSITVTTKGQFSTEQLTVAQDKLAVAEDTLQKGHFKTKLALDQATLSVQTAQAAVDNMSSHMAGASTTTADLTTKIDADQKALDALTTQNEDAAKAMLKANEQLVYQAATAGLSAEAAATVANKMGLMDNATYNMVLQAQALNKEQIAGVITADQLGVASDKLAKSFTAASQPVDYLNGAILTAGGAAHQATIGMDDLNTSINNLHDKSITITTNLVTHGSTYQGPGGGGAAGGADFVVPPGYPNDSYPLRVQSGEHVQVTPATVNNNTYNTVNAQYGGSTSPGAVAQELRLMSYLNR